MFQWIKNFLKFSKSKESLQEKQERLEQEQTTKRLEKNRKRREREPKKLFRTERYANIKKALKDGDVLSGLKAVTTRYDKAKYQTLLNTKNAQKIEQEKGEYFQ